VKNAPRHDDRPLPPGGGLKIGAGVRIVDLAENSQVAKTVSGGGSPRPGKVGTAARFEKRPAPSAANVNQRPALLVLSARRNSTATRRAANRCFSPAGGKPVSRDLWQTTGQVTSSTRRAWAVPFVAYGRDVPRRRTERRNGRSPRSEFFTDADAAETSRKENVLADDEILTHVMLPAPGNVRSGHLRRCATRSRTTWPLRVSPPSC